MQKYWMLAVNGNQCRYGYAYVPFAEYIKNPQIYATAWNQTNWEGKDSVERTCKQLHLELTGNKASLKMKHRGRDHDWGHSYPWVFTSNEIWEVTPGPEFSHNFTSTSVVEYI